MSKTYALSDETIALYKKWMLSTGTEAKINREYEQLKVEVMEKVGELCQTAFEAGWAHCHSEWMEKSFEVAKEAFFREADQD